MTAVEPGRMCMKKTGRDAGEKCVIVKVLDENFVEIVSKSRKKRKCNVSHLELLDGKMKVEDEESLRKKL